MNIIQSRNPSHLLLANKSFSRNKDYSNDKQLSAISDININSKLLDLKEYSPWHFNKKSVKCCILNQENSASSSSSSSLNKILQQAAEPHLSLNKGKHSKSMLINQFPHQNNDRSQDFLKLDDLASLSTGRSTTSNCSRSRSIISNTSSQQHGGIKRDLSANYFDKLQKLKMQEMNEYPQDQNRYQNTPMRDLLKQTHVENIKTTSRNTLRNNQQLSQQVFLESYKLDKQFSIRQDQGASFFKKELEGKENKGDNAMQNINEQNTIRQQQKIIKQQNCLKEEILKNPLSDLKQSSQQNEQILILQDVESMMNEIDCRCGSRLEIKKVLIELIRKIECLKVDNQKMNDKMKKLKEEMNIDKKERNMKEICQNTEGYMEQVNKKLEEKEIQLKNISEEVIKKESRLSQIESMLKNKNELFHNKELSLNNQELSQRISKLEADISCRGKLTYNFMNSQPSNLLQNNTVVELNEKCSLLQKELEKALSRESEESKLHQMERIQLGMKNEELATKKAVKYEQFNIYEPMIMLLSDFRKSREAHESKRIRNQSKQRKNQRIRK